MKTKSSKFITIFLFSIIYLSSFHSKSQSGLERILPLNSQQKQTAKPWVFWYWMQGGVSKAGITADLEAMKAQGIGGAYLMPIKGVSNPPIYSPAVNQLTPEWWEMVKFSMSEASRLGLEMGMHVSDGFALAGGPWIKPEMSMQKVVHSTINIQGNQQFRDKLPFPKINENYYKDIAIFAYKISQNYTSTTNTTPIITSNKSGINPQFLVKEDNKESFRLEEKGWIQYTFEKPFTLRNITVKTGGNNYQAQRLLIEASNDGQNFKTVTRLESPRHGWQDTDADVTHAIPSTRAKYFRFVYDKTGSEAGSEDLDAAKWKPVLKLIGLTLSNEPKIHQYEGKTGEVWRISKRTTTAQVADSLCIPLKNIINITDKVDQNGNLNWNVPTGNWQIIRIGHTSTGHKNDTAGGGKGLECDKFNPEAVTLQFEKWFGEAQKQLGEELSKKALKVFHVDSWECGSQNWSSNFLTEFKQKRGYDLFPYLLVMTGLPIENTQTSEQVLFDIRQTISELVVDKFYKTLADLAHKKGVIFTAESIAPTMTSDGLAHYKLVDVPMGEFWLNSPTHDKPNDMMDAISAAHIYGKNIIQAEGFTTVRMAWNEHPAMLKTLQDRNYTLGINKLVYHVFTHNPWMNQQPGMTLDGVGLYFQRDQTWWKPAKAWVEYAERCQTLLQMGKPVADLAVFTGDEIPRRSVLPDRLVNTLTGLFSKETLVNEQKRLLNEGEPLRQIPAGVSHSANMADPEKWVNSLQGYQYDSFNPDALQNMATVKNGNVQFSEGNSYPILVFPSNLKMNPNSHAIDAKTLQSMLQLVKAGATIIVGEKPTINSSKLSNKVFQTQLNELWDGQFLTQKNDSHSIIYKKLGKGKIIKAPFEANSFDKLGILRDLIVKNDQENYAQNIAWTHRKMNDMELYFISNQVEKNRQLSFSLRANQPFVYLYSAVSDELTAISSKVENGRTQLMLNLEANESIFIILSKKVLNASQAYSTTLSKTIEGTWKVSFDDKNGQIKNTQNFEKLSDWSVNQDSLIRYFSGTATYQNSFQINKTQKRYWLDLGEVANIANVKVNGVNCGVAWTAPYRVEITKAIREGENQLNIEVSNTWANRLIGDNKLPENQRITKTTAPFRLAGKALEKSGLLGEVKLLLEK
ncbi:F5/8 type C domain-containing protein [Arcicella aurantiaca]|uniref:F5/8 type C domain-containing protein n=1 Tax=Arcicella aurantiaca TaxID=591202 RepID=A0A316EAX6_9BACT|nr:glycosyl hydrolase [Arcicella aurantiaca]PWK27572.1 F5/8 type C domain-containing protein [Arcicella aurantiaca]